MAALGELMPGAPLFLGFPAMVSSFSGDFDFAARLRRARGKRSPEARGETAGEKKEGLRRGRGKEPLLGGSRHLWESDHESVGCGANTWMPEPLAGGPQALPVPPRCRG